MKVERGRAWRGLGYNLVEEGKLDEAEAMYRKCLELDPDDAKSQGELRSIGEQRKRHT
jgi:Flp pilus assembly protein TadD